jgi:hypothetical protein
VPESAIARVIAGLRFVRGQPVLLAAVSLDLVSVMFSGATALLPVYASDILRVGPWGLGALRAAPALGAAITAVALARWPLSRRAGPSLLGCVAIYGAATVGFGASRDLAASLAALAVIGAADMVSVVVRSSLIQLRTPPDLRGRVSAVHMMFVAGSSSLGELESGAAAAWLGAGPAVIAGGIAAVLAAGIYAAGSRALRTLDRVA